MNKNKRIWKMKASITVEAAFVCPLLCLAVCGMLFVTLQLYEKVEQYAIKLQTESKEGVSTVELIRLEAIIEELL